MYGSQYDDVYSSLFEIWSRSIDIPAGEREKLRRYSSIRSLREQEIFIHQGEVPRYLAFIIKGLMRKFYIDNNGKDITKFFCLENSFVSAFAAFLCQEEAYYSVEALEDTTLVLLPYDDFHRMLEEHVCWLKVYNKALERFYIIKERREQQFLLEDAKGRYMQFLKDYPGLEKRVKQYQVASYLGITPVSLSRIRTDLAQANS